MLQNERIKVHASLGMAFLRPGLLVEGNWGAALFK